MSKLVFLTGDFCSGSTLLFTLFRATRQYHCLYEPLHPLLPEYLIWPLRAYEHHYFVRDYFTEYAGYRRIHELFDPAWASTNLYMDADFQAAPLRRYLDYLIQTSFTKRSRVLLKFNRANFRLPWLRAHFPEAKVIHVYRDKESEWKSIVRRGQEHRGVEDIGQHSPHFQGFNIAPWCEDLKSTFPELAAEESRSGFERFSKLYDRSLEAQRAYADISIEYRVLCRNFDHECRRMFDAADCSADLVPLRALVVPPEKQQHGQSEVSGFGLKTAALVDRLGRKYAKARVSLAQRRRKRAALA